MYRVLQIETKKYFLSPITIGFLIFPILIYTIILLLLNPPIALSSTIFVQIIFIAIFSYGVKIRVYRNKNIKQKIINSKFKLINPTIVLLFLSIIFIMLTLFLPFCYTIASIDSIGKLERNQYLIFQNWESLNTTETIAEYLKDGTRIDYLLFNSNIKTMMRFIFALFLVGGSIFGISHLISVSVIDESKYFSIIITLFILIIIFSSIFTKDIFLMKTNEYTMSPESIENKFFIILKYLNPFFWMNQIIMNTIIADSGSGIFIPDYLPPGLEYIESPGTFVFEYYNIFHIGTDISELSSSNFSRVVYTENIELHQLLCLIYPSIILVMSITVSSIKGLI